MTTAGTVVIVDTYMSTRRLAPEFHRAGFATVRVQSTATPPLVYSAGHVTEDFIDNIVHLGDLAETLRAVAKHEPVAVLAAGELGVELADRLSEELGLPTNGTALSPARRDKHVQIETVRRAGLRAARQLLVTNEAELASWHREIGGRVVVKPLRSAAGDGVAFCDEPAAALAAYRAILTKETIFGGANGAAVAQEYLFGGEYVVNTVSRDGRHQVTDIWKYTKVDTNGVRDLIAGAYLLPRHGEVQDQLVPYAFEVLDALGIRHGPGHFEIKLTPDGPCLVEVGARLSGLDKPYYARVGTGQSQLDWVVDAYARPERFHEQVGQSYRIHSHVGIATLAAPFEGTLAGYPLLPVVEQLESHHDTRLLVPVGGRLRRTVDDMTWPVTIGLAHPVPDVLLRDLNTIKYLDGPGFYRLAEPTPGHAS
ncbi:ATP-grasp domain-containing protein [Kitasatospora sp. NBC_01287]|uniref:ATP-grasp domain-containing protein n=1 Tax=Kitasatospora sp. NBC_01287 TaxID=2903573 RepID=UPI0022563011|nr:ATP-grasp domain-containing protein [Kitasatospora sp. NBC_01287]MCX4746942.1 ATP-grasp domain-containing protein [Kitasatospora sp. NBC_01287]